MTEFLYHDDDLMTRALAEFATRDTSNRAYAAERFATWLVRRAERQAEIRRQGEARRMGGESRTHIWAAQVTRAADHFASTLAGRITAARLARRYPRAVLCQRDAPVTGTFAQTVALAAAARCVPRVDLRVAAGVGRELWDEACDAWVELPAGASRGTYVALTVGGDSMTPLLNDGDVILVQLRTQVARDSVIVARRPEDGYVVKHVARVGRTVLELASLNPAYAPFTIARDPALIVGTVVARLGENPDIGIPDIGIPDIGIPEAGGGAEGAGDDVHSG